MGSGTSRGIKVAPACVSEINVSKRDASVSSPKQERHPAKPLTTSDLTNVPNSRNGGQLDCHSEGQSQDSEFSDEDDDIDVELERVLADYDEDQVNVSMNNSAKKSTARSKTYDLCHFKRVHTGKTLNLTPRLPKAVTKEPPRDRDSGSQDVNKMSNGVSSHFKTPIRPSNQQSTPSQGLTGGSSVQPVPTQETESRFGNCQSPSINMPIFQYDGSEEELMDTIEREFN